MNPRTMVVVGLTCAAVVGAQLAAGVLFFGGALVNDVVIQPQREARAHVEFAPGGFLNDMIDEVQGIPQAKPCTREELQAARGPVTAASKCTYSGPFTHENLSVVLIHGPDTMKDQRVMPLQAALEQNLATVHAAISIDNRANMPLFIQAGDIIKGGTQDRVLPYDYLVPVGTNHLPLTVFCVEAGRCGPRGQEISHSFQSSTEQLPGNKLHLAARYRHNQGEVWQGVQQVQQALARNVGGSVQSPQSQTSLQLTLESDRLQQAIQNYVNELGPRTVGANDVIGVAVAVNGRIQSAEVYGSSGLFLELWPKLLKANAIAALAERQPGAAAAAPTVEAVQKFLAVSEKGSQCRTSRNAGTLVLQQETDRVLLYDTCDATRQNVVLHRSYLAK